MKFMFHRRKTISLLCVMLAILGMSVQPILAETEDATIIAGPYTFTITDPTKNIIALSEYDVTKNPTNEVSINKIYSGSAGSFYVVGIKASAFQGKSLSSLEVNTTVVKNKGFVDKYSIESNAFQDTEIGLSSSNPKAIFQGGEITAIGRNAFENAKIGCNLEFDKVNGGINSYAFKNIEINGYLIIHGSLTWLDPYALEGSKMKGVMLPNSIEEIGDGVFKDAQVKEWKMQENVKKLGSKIFEGCSTLTKITLPSTDMEREIAEDAFPDQAGLTIIIPKGLTDLSVFHLENYKNPTFQTDSSLTEDSPVIIWLKEHGLTYKVGENGQVVTPTPDDISEPTPTPTEEATPTPTEEATSIPTEEPTPTPTEKPTPVPTEEPTPIPTEKPTPVPTEEPTPTPAEKPTPAPTEEATPTPTEEPTPAEKPTPDPTEEPTPVPAEKPTPAPTEEPTLAPAEKPTPVPTKEPVLTPEPSGTAAPSASPVPDQKLVPEENMKNSVHTIKNVRYKIKDDNNVVVTGAVKKNLKKLQIPGTVKISGRLYKVTSIQKKAFKGQKKLETVSIGNYVTDVGNEAFAECTKLKKIQFGTGLKRLGKKVLYKDKKLKKIIFKGKKLKKIGKKTFYGVPQRVDIRAVRSKVKYYAKLINRSKK